MTTPRLSVVVPTHDRLPHLRACLGALAAQRVAPERLADLGAMEVVVVADGCADGTEAALAEARTTGAYPFALRAVAQPAAGAAAARNRGATEARAPLLLFLDDDVVALPGLVDAHLRAHADGAERAVVGPCLPGWSDDAGYLAAALRRFWLDAYAAMADPRRRHLLSGNLSLPRATFEAAGGFDPALVGALEDYELGVRLAQRGVELAYAPEAEARHLETTDLAASLRRNRNAGRATVRFVRAHPALRATTRLARRDPLPRALAFRATRLGRAFAAAAPPLLRTFERLGQRRAWTALFGQLRAYWFWRGVADELGSEAALDAYLALLTPPADPYAEPHRLEPA